MKIKLCILLLAFLLFVGCSANSSGVSGSVIDAETGQSVEGAVVYVEWTRGVARWTGLGYTKTYKVVERVTGADGKFSILGVLYPFVDPPKIIVYKKGYVAWRNDFIFPGYRERTDYEQEKRNVVKLEHFKRYSHSKHISFFSGDLTLSSTKLEQACSWEFSLAQKEEELAREKIKLGRTGEYSKTGEYSEEKLWKEIIDELYPEKGASQ